MTSGSCHFCSEANTTSCASLNTVWKVRGLPRVVGLQPYGLAEAPLETRSWPFGRPICSTLAIENDGNCGDKGLWQPQLFVADADDARIGNRVLFDQ